MSKTFNHINKKKLVTTLLSLVVFVLLYMAVGHKKNLEIESVNIRISKNTDQKDLISKIDVLVLFRGYLGYDILMANYEDLDLKMLEQVLRDDPRVKKAEIYIGANNKLNVYIKQRKPIVRVNAGDVYHYYLDREGFVIPVSYKDVLRVPVASGNLEDVNKGLKSKHKTNLKDVFEVAKYINEDEFLAALIEQIHVKEDNTIVMIPKLGKEKIIVGDVANMEQNFENLKIYYRNVLPKNGWHQFAELNLSYKNQILATKRSM